MSSAAMVIVEADNLRPTAPLRKAAESHKAAMALPCYALEARDIGRLIRQYLEQENYRIEAQAMDLLTARLATDRGVIQRELERLVLYKGVRAAKAEPGMVTGDDVEAALGDQAQGDFDRLIDSVALGRLDEADRAMARLEAAGTNAAGALAMARLHFQTLHLALGQMERGMAQTKALGAFRPPLHFRRKPLVEQQMRLWSSSKCARALEILNAAEKGCRGSAGGLAQAQAGNALLRIARAAHKRAGEINACGAAIMRIEKLAAQQTGHQRVQLLKRFIANAQLATFFSFIIKRHIKPQSVSQLLFKLACIGGFFRRGAP